MNIENIFENGCFFQDLNLEVGERASCYAGYPVKVAVIVECIKNFSEADDSDFILNNPFLFVKEINRSKYGICTSHFISSKWIADDYRFYIKKTF